MFKLNKTIPAHSIKSEVKKIIKKTVTEVRCRVTNSINWISRVAIKLNDQIIFARRDIKISADQLVRE